MNQISLHKCVQKKPIVITDDINGELFCGLCGTVLKEKIVDRSHDVGSFSKEVLNTKKRTGPPLKTSIFDMGSSSVIPKTNIDSSGKYISSTNKFHFSRLRRWDSQSKHNQKNKKLIRAFILLNSIKSKLNLPENVRERSAYIYRKASEKNIVRGNSTNSMIAAAVFVACKQLGIPRSLYEISHVVNIKRKMLSHTYRRLVSKLELDVVSNSVDYVTKVANSVGADEKTKRLSHQILNDAKKDKVHVGKNPVGLAAGAVYLSGIGVGKNISMSKISSESNISTVTIRKIVRILRPFAAKYIETIASHS